MRRVRPLECARPKPASDVVLTAPEHVLDHLTEDYAAVTGIGLEEGRMLPENAAALVGAGMVSVLLFPFIALQLRGRHLGRDPAAASQEGF